LVTRRNTGVATPRAIGIVGKRASSLSMRRSRFWSAAAVTVGLIVGGTQWVKAQTSEAGVQRKPTVLYTDILSGPNEGGENNKGAYLSIFGRNFGSAGLGSRVKVFIGDAEVDNYRYLGRAKGLPDVQQLTVQIGSLGQPARGVRMAVKVIVDGVSSNSEHTFMVNPGTIFFVSPSGSDFRGDGSFAKPYRTVQTVGTNNNGIVGCPIAGGEQSIATAGVWGFVRPGDFIVLRGGQWTDVSRDGFFLRVQNKSGTPPAGIANTGPITIMGYPGEVAFIDRTNASADTLAGGGIASADTARQRLGCGAWITVANLSIESGFNDGPINVQRGTVNPAGSNWRVVNNELTAKSCQLTTKCRAGGVAGGGKGNFWVGNHIHDVHDKLDGYTDFENHGIYIGEDGSYDIAYNLIENIEGGNGIQTHGGSSATISNVRVHHNLIRAVGKHGINVAEGSEAGFMIFQNVVSSSGVAGLRLNAPNLSGAKVFNNVFFDTDQRNWGGSRAAIMNDASLLPGALEFKNNIVVPSGLNRNYVGGSTGFGSVGASLSHNLWFGGKSCNALLGLVGRACTLGSAAIMSDPYFASTKSNAEDFRLLPNSPARAAGEGISVNSSLHFSRAAKEVLAAPRRVDLGAYEMLR
jgi:hypothetical protein